MDITLHGNIAEIVLQQTHISGYDSPEELIFDALKALVNQKIEEGIDRGLKDVEKGRFVELNPENIDELLSKPVEQWLK